MPVIVGIKGEFGSHHRKVANELLGDALLGDPSAASIVNAKNFRELFDKLESGKITHALAAIENSNGGYVTKSQRFLRSGEVTFVGEHLLVVHHQLAGLDGATLAGAERIYSAPEAIGQCALFFERDDIPEDVDVVNKEDTAQSARLVRSSKKLGILSISSQEAADYHRLAVIEHDIEDPGNITRFVLVKKREAGELPRDPTHNKTSMLVTTEQAPGSSQRVLDVIGSYEDLNIASNEHNSIPMAQDEVEFLLEIEAGLADPRTEGAIRQIRELGNRVLVLGSYRKGQVPMIKKAKKQYAQADSVVA